VIRAVRPGGAGFVPDACPPDPIPGLVAAHIALVPRFGGVHVRPAGEGRVLAGASGAFAWEQILVRIKTGDAHWSASAALYHQAGPWNRS
jgi:hypothetical protein